MWCLTVSIHPDASDSFHLFLHFVFGKGSRGVALSVVLVFISGQRLSDCLVVVVPLPVR